MLLHIVERIQMNFINLEYHPADSRIKIVDDEICQTLSSRMGTGGNNVPLILIQSDETDSDIDRKKVLPLGRG